MASQSTGGPSQVSKGKGVDARAVIRDARAGDNIHEEPNLMSVTVKQLADATNARQTDQPLVVNHCISSTFQICGRVVELQEEGRCIKFTIDDGTGRIKAKTWVEPEAFLSSIGNCLLGTYYMITGHLRRDIGGTTYFSAYTTRKIVDFNEVPLHFLQVVHHHLELTKEKPEDEEGATYLQYCMEKILDFLAEPENRASERGPSTASMLNALDLPAMCLHEALRKLNRAGCIYTTVSKYNYKLGCEWKTTVVKEEPPSQTG
ncbi:hypothetical protein QOZ80_1AG0046700 [Eleusine coracana subsp. coracana]|nr:hypothetical protein QOZ80_1AG0046700 [Eleusine coracana subsp. coracana]